MNGLKSREERSASNPDALRQIDSCYAYRRDREVVKMLWPAQHRPPS
jgi:hypothetical protein